MWIWWPLCNPVGQWFTMQGRESAVSPWGGFVFHCFTVFFCGFDLKKVKLNGTNLLKDSLCVCACAFHSIFLNVFFLGEEVRAEFFMEELNNGVKLCQLIGVLQTKIAQSCPSALSKVSQNSSDENNSDSRPAGSLHAHTCLWRALQVTVWTKYL